MKFTIYIDGSKFSAPSDTIDRIVATLITSGYKYCGPTKGYFFDDSPELPLDKTAKAK